jgi:hypothetical protein
VERDLCAEFIGNTVKEETSDPEMVTHINALARADLEFPLGGHSLSAGTRDVDTCIQASLVVSLYNVSAEDFASTYTAIVWTLRTQETIDWPAIRPVRHIKKCVFLLKTEPWLMLLVCLHKLGSLVTVVELVRGSIGIPAFGHDQNIWGAAKRIRENRDRSKIDVRVVAWSLSSGGTIEVPFWEVLHGVRFAVLRKFCQSLRF